jgi:hypothetical protein
MLLVRSIQEIYLWVDALCIAQDDYDNQKAQIPQMAAIYANALFTIIALAGDDANAGLPGVRLGTRTIKQEILRARDSSLVTIVGEECCRGISIHNDSELNDQSSSTWFTRVWTMQEYLFSTRSLVFTQEQFYWRCQKGNWMEQTALEKARAEGFQGVCHNRWGHVDRLLTDFADFKEYQNSYTELVEAYYKRRNLTNASDILNAFSGIIRALSI